MTITDNPVEVDDRPTTEDVMGWTLTDEPKPQPARWFGLDLRNLAGFNDHGRATWGTRIPKIVADIKYVGREVVAVIELPNGKVDDFVRRMVWV